MLIDDVARDIGKRIWEERRIIRQEDLVIYMSRDFAMKCVIEISGAVSDEFRRV